MRLEDSLEKILIVDFGSQYTQLIARKIREQNVYSEIVPAKIKYEEILKKNPAAIILSGGPSSVFEDKAPDFDKKVLDSDFPILGICYGIQLIAINFGGKVKKGKKRREFGKTALFKK